MPDKKIPSPQEQSDDDIEKLDRDALIRLVQSLKERPPQDELALSEAKYRNLVEGSSDLIYILDAEGRFSFANKEVGRLLGYAPDEIIGKRFDDLLDAESVEALGYALKERRVGPRATHRLEVQLKTRSGEIRDVELDVRHLSFNASGLYRGDEFVGTHGVARDITERKYNENKLRTLQAVRGAVRDMTRPEDISNVLAAIKDGIERMRIPYEHCSIHLLDLEDPPRLKLYSGRRRQPLAERGIWTADTDSGYARTVVEIWRAAAPACRLDLDKEDLYSERPQLETLYGPVRTAVDMPFSHGTLSLNTPVADAFAERDLDFLGELAEVLTDAFRRRRDLQDLALSEKRYRTLVEGPHLVVMLVDTEGNFIYISPQIQAWLGYEPEAFYRDSGLWQRLIHADDLDQIAQFYVLDPNKRLQNAEFRWQHADGNYRRALASVFPIYDSEADEMLDRVRMVQVVIQDLEEI